MGAMASGKGQPPNQAPSQKPTMTTAYSPVARKKGRKGAAQKAEVSAFRKLTDSVVGMPSPFGCRRILKAG